MRSVTATARHAETAARLRVAVARLARMLRQQSPGGLTLTQWSALSTVDQHGPVRIGDLAERERVSPPTATRMVAALEAEGLLARTGDPTDRRTSYVAVTEAGRQKLEWARGVRTAALAQRLSAMPPEDAERLAELLPLLESLLTDE
jgi:DNA-binding MarR family transcriptional regulator